MTADYRVFFSEKDPRFQAFDAFESTLVVKPTSGDVLDSETLAVVYALTEKAWQIPHFVRLDSVASMRLGLISLVSNMFPVLITLGLWAIPVGEVRIIASVIIVAYLKRASGGARVCLPGTVTYGPELSGATPALPDCVARWDCEEYRHVRISRDSVGRGRWSTLRFRIVAAMHIKQLRVQTGVRGRVG
jgi:hypothetical protein